MGSNMIDGIPLDPIIAVQSTAIMFLVAFFITLALGGPRVP